MSGAIDDAALQRSAALRVSRRRSQALLAREPALGALLPTRADVEALSAARTCVDQLATACARFATHPCLGERMEIANGEPRLAASFRTIDYATVWRRVQALATGLATAGLVRRGERVALCGFATIDWLVADLACLYLGATTVPLQSTMASAELAHILTETEPACLVCSAEHVALLAPLVGPSARSIVLIDGGTPEAVSLPTHAVAELEATESEIVPPARPAAGEDPLVTIMYTSGSTGLPKGVLYPESRWSQRLAAALVEAPLPLVTVGYLPLSHMAGRLTAHRVMMRGGVTYFVPRSDMSTLFDDIRAVRPTLLTLVPRVSGLIYQRFQAELVRRGKEPGRLDLDDPVVKDVMAELKDTLLGDRLCRIDTGAAPTAPAVIAFLERCFDVTVVNAYGATELGLVTVNDRIQPGVSYRLADVPELGYRTSDRPYPRGELLVKSPHKAPGYFRNVEASEKLRDADGFLRSGDIVEERGPGHVVWIDRKNNILRLAQGEFVSTTRLEELFTTSSVLVEQAYVYGNPHRAYVLAVLVPNADELARRGSPDAAAVRRLLRAELERTARDARLPRHEVPRDFIVEHEPFSVDNQLLTESNKPRRPRLRERYGDALEALYAALEVRQLGAMDGLEGASVRARIEAALGVTLGLPPGELDVDSAESSFTGLGGDSLGAVRFCELVKDACGAAPSMSAVLDRSTPIATLVLQVEAKLAGDARPGFEAVHGASAEVVRASDLDVARLLELDGDRSPITHPPREVVLTGATGFLGRFLLLELLERAAAVDGHVICLVRGDARARLRASFGSDATLLRRFDELASRLVVHAGNLTRPRLGLDAPAYDALSERADAVVHNGALVNHALSYAQLFEPNVLGTVEVMRLALARRVKPIHYVSTIGVAAGLRRDTPVMERESAASLFGERPIGAGPHDYGVGYNTSKWACELLLGQLAERFGVPVTIFRCSMILGHRVFAQVNDGDMIVRLLYGILRAGVAPASFYAPAYRGQRHLDGLPVDVVARAIAAIVAQPAAGTRTYHVSNSRWGDGLSLDTLVDWMGAAIERLPYADWYREVEQRLGRLDEARRRRSLLPVLARWRRPAGEGSALVVDTRELEAKLRELGVELPALDEAYGHHLLRAVDALDR